MIFHRSISVNQLYVHQLYNKNFSWCYGFKIFHKLLIDGLFRKNCHKHSTMTILKNKDISLGFVAPLSSKTNIVMFHHVIWLKSLVWKPKMNMLVLSWYVWWFWKVVCAYETWLCRHNLYSLNYFWISREKRCFKKCIYNCLLVLTEWT